MRAVLVTGGAGYVGSHVCRELSMRGFLPVVLDNLCNGHRWAVRWGPLHLGDIADAAAVLALVREYSPVAVVHMAAFAYVGESVSDPGRYWRNNVAGSLALLECLVQEGLRNIVFSSTCAVYGTPASLPIIERTETAPINPYGRSKLAVEWMLGDFGLSHGLRHVCLRYFNAAGADPDGLIGELHEPEPHLIPNILEVAAGGRDALNILGDDYPTPDGTCIRDYIHVCDLARAHVAAVDHLLSGGDPIALNLGAGKGTSVRELVGMVERVTGRAIPVRVLPRRPGDPPALVADCTLARQVIGFEPSSSDLDTIIRSAWRWRTDRLPEVRANDGNRP